MKNALLIFLAAYTLSSCSKSNTNTATNSTNSAIDYGNSAVSLLNDTAGVYIEIDSLPLKVGNTWNYLIQSAGSAAQTYTVQVVADTLIKGERAALVTSTINNVAPAQYYANRKDGCYIVAEHYSNPDSIHIFIPAILTISFPVVAGTNWQTIDSIYGGGVAISYSTWQGFYKTNTPTGIVNCARLNEYESQRPGYPDYYKYYSVKGMVKSVQLADAYENNGRGPLNFTTQNTITLVSTNF